MALAAPLLHCAGVWQDAQQAAEFPCFTLVTMCGEYAEFNLWQGPAHRWRFGAPPPVHEIAGRRCSLLRPACGSSGVDKQAAYRRLLPHYNGYGVGRRQRSRRW